MCYPPWSASTAAATAAAKQHEYGQAQLQQMASASTLGLSRVAAAAAGVTAAQAQISEARARVDDAQYVHISASGPEEDDDELPWGSRSDPRPSSVMDLVARLSPPSPSRVGRAGSTSAKDTGGPRDVGNGTAAPRPGQIGVAERRLSAAAKAKLRNKSPKPAPQAASPGATRRSVYVAPPLTPPSDGTRRVRVARNTTPPPGVDRSYFPFPDSHREPGHSQGTARQAVSATPPSSPLSGRQAVDTTPPLSPLSGGTRRVRVSRSMTPTRRTDAGSVTPPRSPVLSSRMAAVGIPSSQRQQRSVSQTAPVEQQDSDGNSSPLTRSQTFAGSFSAAGPAAASRGAAHRSVTPPRSQDRSPTRTALSALHSAWNIRQLLPQTLSGHQVSSAASPSSSAAPPLGVAGGPQLMRPASNARNFPSCTVPNGHGETPVTPAAPSTSAQSAKLLAQRSSSGFLKTNTPSPVQLRDTTPVSRVRGRCASPVLTMSSASAVSKFANASLAEKVAMLTNKEELHKSLNHELDSLFRDLARRRSQSGGRRSQKPADPKTPNHASRASLTPPVDGGAPPSLNGSSAMTTVGQASQEMLKRAPETSFTASFGQVSSEHAAEAAPPTAVVCTSEMQRETAAYQSTAKVSEDQLAAEPGSSMTAASPWAATCAEDAAAEIPTAVVCTSEMQREAAAHRGMVNANEEQSGSTRSLGPQVSDIQKAVESPQKGISETPMRQVTPTLQYHRNSCNDNSSGMSKAVTVGSGDSAGSSAEPLQVQTVSRTHSVNRALDECGRTMLIYAASEGDVATVEALLQEGAIIDTPDECGCTALMYAASRGHLGVVQRLARSGAELDAPSLEGWTPLLAAAAAGHADVVRCLVQTGAGVDLRDAKGWSALMHATFNRFLPTVLCLLDHGASPMVIDTEGRSALAYAAHHGDLDIAQALVKRHPTASRRADEVAGIALHNAVLQGHSEVAQCLLGVSVPRAVRAAAMKLAVEKGHFGIVETIVRQVHADSKFR